MTYTQAIKCEKEIRLKMLRDTIKIANILKNIPFREIDNANIQN